MENNGEKLSQKSYSIIRLLKYIAFVCLIAMMFLPIIRIESVDEQMDMKATASISPFQLLIGDTVTEAKIDAGDEELDGFLNGLIGSEARKVDVVKEAFNFSGDDDFAETLVKIVRISLIAFGVLMGLLSIGSSNTLAKRLTMVPTNANEVIIQDHAYITQVFTGFPKIFEVIETFVVLNIGFSLMFIGMFNVAVSMVSELEMEWRIDIWWTVIAFVISVLLKNATITKIIFSKERKKIELYSARYDAPYAHTLSSDFLAISSIWNTQKPTEKTEESELYKYKKLLDDGIITQEEYEQKKKEILNL